jgi:hypothetical protein
MRGGSNRYYPGALVWLVRRPGRALRERAEMWLAWKRVMEDMTSGILGTDFDAADRKEVFDQIRESEEMLRDEVWASYRHAVVADVQGSDGLKAIDFGAGHASSGTSFTGKVIVALKAEGLLNDSVGAGYLERNWPPALKDGGAWPLKGLRQAFLDGTLTRLLDPEEVLRKQIVTFVEKGDMGLASGPQPDGSYQRIWWKEPIGPEEVTFDDKTFLLNRARAASVRVPSDSASTITTPASDQPPEFALEPPSQGSGATQADDFIVVTLRGNIPPEQWNKLGTKLIPKLRTSGSDLKLSLDASVRIRAGDFQYLEADLRQALRDIGLEGLVRIERQG